MRPRKAAFPGHEITMLEERPPEPRSIFGLGLHFGSWGMKRVAPNKVAANKNKVAPNKIVSTLAPALVLLTAPFIAIERVEAACSPDPLVSGGTASCTGRRH